MKRLREIQIATDDFRVDVIRALLTAFPGRAVDDEDPSNDIFLIDGIPVRLESDRIVVGDDLNGYIPLKNPPIAGNPPQYRDVDSILADFRAYVNKEKRESYMRSIYIKKDTRVPGTNIVLESGDRIMYRESADIFRRSDLKKPGDTWYSKDKYWMVYWDKDDKDTIWVYHTDKYGDDYYEVEDLNRSDVSQIVFRGHDSDYEVIA